MQFMEGKGSLDKERKARNIRRGRNVFINNLRETILAWTRDRIFSLKLLIYDLPDGYSERKILIKCVYV